MKWRSLLVLACVVFGLFTSSFSNPQTTSAAANFQSIFSRTTDDLFIARTGSINSMGSLTQADKTALISLFGQAKSAYEDVFVSSSQPEDLDSILLIYYSALGAAINILESGKGGLSPAAQAVVNPSISFFQSEQSSGAKVRSLYTGTVQDPGSRNAEEAARRAATNETDPLATCSLWSGEGILACFTGLLDWLIRVTILQLAGFVLWLSSNLLAYVIDMGIIQFSQWAPDALYALWQIVRQVISMFVVFSGLYIGFMYIIGQKAAFQRYFVWIVIFGIFVNFSYPVTRAAIDLSNIVSISIYSKTVGSTAGDTIGAKLMTKLGLQKLVMSASATSEITDTSTSGDMLAKGGLFSTILAIGYILYAAYIFFIAAGILIMRTLALSFIIVASPLLFVDSVIPKLGEHAQKLRGIFFQQLSVSIVFMIMLFLAVQMTSVFKNIGSSSGAGLVSTDTAQVFNILMMLVVLHIMLKVTKATAGAIGQMASDYVGKVGGFATGAAIGLATGGTGLLARGTIGAAAANWSKSEGEKALRGEASAHDSWTGRQRLALATSLAGSNFDLKDSKLVQGLAGTMGGASMTKGLGFVGRVKSYDQAKEVYDKETESRAGMLRGDRRAEYLEGRQSGPLASLYGKEKAEMVAKKLKDEDKTLLQKYANASKDVKEMMRNDPKNASYLNDFKSVDRYLDSSSTDDDRDFILSKYGGDKDLQKMLRDQRIASLSKASNDAVSLVKKYFETDPRARGVLGEGATQEDKELLASIDKYKTAATEKDKADILKSLGNDVVAKAVIASDNDITTAAKNRVRAAYYEATNQETQLVKDEVKQAGVDISEMFKKTPGGGTPSPQVASTPKTPPSTSGNVVETPPATPPPAPVASETKESASA